VPAGLSGAEFGRLLDETIAALRPVDAGETDAAIRGQGEALDGQVRVVAAPGGTLESLSIAASAMRSDSRTLAAEILRAANAALEDLRGKVTAATPTVADPAALADRLREAQQHSAARMGVFLQALGDVQDQILRARG